MSDPADERGRPADKVCHWCHDAPGDALPGLDICTGCLDEHEIPPRMISGQLDEPVTVVGGGLSE